MNLFIYSDESGVFDKYHNDYFVYAGLILINKEEKDAEIRKFLKAESVFADKYPDMELKATFISNKEKNKLFRSLNNVHKFSVIIKQKEIMDKIFSTSRDKRRFLDYAFKMGIKNALIDLSDKNILNLNDVKNIYFNVDEHTTATNGIYDLRETLLSEFKYGTYNYKYSLYFPPITNNLSDLNVKFCDSKTTALVRASDILANNIYFKVVSNRTEELDKIKNFSYKFLP